MPSTPPPGRRFEPGNPGKPKGAKPISHRRARKLVEASIIAEAAGPARVGDFDGDALGYLQEVYSGKRVGDPLRLSAAVQALKFERPALAAVAVATTTQLPTTPAERLSRIRALLEGRGVVEVDAGGIGRGPGTIEHEPAGGVTDPAGDRET